MSLHGNEAIWVVGVSGNGQLAATLEQTTTAEIAALGGGGGISNIVQVTSGTTVSGQLQTYYVWNSATAAPKNIDAPIATGSGHVIAAIDQFGSAFTYPINFVPNGGDMVIGSQTQVYTNNGSAVWRDLLPGVWGVE